MSYTNLVYHIVFRTYRSIPAIDEEHERELYAYAHGYITRHRAGYAAFTYSVEQIPVVKQYIINQKEHHRQVTFAEEYRRFIMDCGGEIDERFFLKG